jgi:hypothetical protein
LDAETKAPKSPPETTNSRRDDKGLLADGFAWNGQTYDSLTKVAFAITGTRWNGPRFFGLRDKQAPPTSEAGR